MRYGLVFPGGTPTEIVDAAVAAEAAGWDGVFCFEGIYHYDPWVILSAIATRTERIMLGTMLTPAPRRRPWKLAAECVSLDELSGGRTILTVGIGAFDTGLGDMATEEHDNRIRAEILDETIDLLRAMWSGEPVQHSGTHYTVQLPAGPKPIRDGGIPIWCVGVWPRPKSMRRILRCDGVLAQGAEQPQDIAAVVEWLRANGKDDIDVIAEGTTTAPNAAETIEPWADAGATWWIEANWGAEHAAVRERIEAGPPR